MDIVLPISARRRSGAKSDLLRLKTLLTSVDRFWFGGSRVVIITPDREEVWAEIRRFEPEYGFRFRIDVIADEELFPALPAKLHPWWRQQILKLAACNAAQTDNYLILDADCFFTRRTYEEDLTDENLRARVAFGEGCAYSHKSWYRGCRKLGLPTPDKAVNVTPFVMNSELAVRAFDFIKDQPESISKTGWSEYTLYHSLAVSLGLWDDFHYEDKPLLGNEVWRPEELSTWDASKSFQGDHHLCLVQSNTGVTADWVWERVRGFLQ